jgi:hypothetical protein
MIFQNIASYLQLWIDDLLSHVIINRHCVSDEIDSANKRIYDGDGKISEMKNSI